MFMPIERIERSIFLLRGQKVMLDVDLAALYEVETRALNQAVKRNKKRYRQSAFTLIQGLHLGCNDMHHPFRCNSRQV